MIAPGSNVELDVGRDVDLLARAAWLQAEDDGPWGGRTYGTELDLSATWEAAPWISFGAEVDVLLPGDFFGGGQHGLQVGAGRRPAHAMIASLAALLLAAAPPSPPARRRAPRRASRATRSCCATSTCSSSSTCSSGSTCWCRRRASRRGGPRRSRRPRRRGPGEAPRRSRPARPPASRRRRPPPARPPARAPAPGPPGCGPGPRPHPAREASMPQAACRSWPPE